MYAAYYSGFAFRPSRHRFYKRYRRHSKANLATRFRFRGHRREPLPAPHFATSIALLDGIRLGFAGRYPGLSRLVSYEEFRPFDDHLEVPSFQLKLPLNMSSSSSIENEGAAHIRYFARSSCLRPT